MFRRRKTVLDISKAFCCLRRCYPRKRLFVILDNLRHVHDHPRFLALAAPTSNPTRLDPYRSLLA
jgi:hypothetical protein